MSVPSIVTNDFEDSFEVFMPHGGGFDVRAINPDGSIAATLDNFDDELEARQYKRQLVEHVRFWARIGVR